MHYLITGGAGFIGSHLAESMLADGHQVTVLDNLSTGSLANLETCLTHPAFLFVQGSVVDPYLVDDVVDRCDVVVHLAAAVGVELIMQQPLRAFTTNVRGGEVVLEAAHRYGKKTFMASTSEIYGKNGGEPMAESADRILGPTDVVRWSYSTSKAVDEILTTLYHRERGLPTVIARFFNTVGPRQTPAYGMVIPRLMRQALLGQDLTVYGDGRQTRCFVHVADAVSAIRLLVDSDDAVGRTVNIGSTEEITILDLAQRIIDVVGTSSQVRLVSYEEAFGEGFEDMRRRVPDITAAADLVGWQPTVDLDRILLDTRDDMAPRLSESAARTIVLPDSRRSAPAVP